MPYRNYKKKKYSNYRTYSRARKYMASMTGGRGTADNIRVYGKNWQNAKGPQRAFRQTMGYRGNGAYFSKNPTYAKAIRNAGEWAGNALGYGYGVGPAAGAAGRHLAGVASKYMGFGAYEPQAVASGNQLMVGGVGDTPAQQTIEINNTGNETGDIVMSQTEFVSNVYATAPPTGNSSAFEVQSYSINPALSKTFPFLAQLAINFDTYNFNGLAFQYKSSSGEYNSTSNSLGKVIMATNYDPGAPDFVSSVQMENYAYANSSKPSLGMVHGVETAKSQSVLSNLYTRGGDNSKKPIEFTDLGKFQIATEGIPSFQGAQPGDRQIVGELWVTYSVVIKRPQLYTSLGQNIAHGGISLQSNQNIVEMPSNLIAKENVDVVSSTNSEIVLSIGNTQANLDQGRYLLTCKLSTEVGADLTYAPPSGNPPVDTPLEFYVTGDTNSGFTNLQSQRTVASKTPGVLGTFLGTTTGLISTILLDYSPTNDDKPLVKISWFQFEDWKVTPNSFLNADLTWSKVDPDTTLYQTP